MTDIFGQSQRLIVVYKDELVLNQLKKLVETNDDMDDGEIVGTEDGTVEIVSWDEKTWLAQKKAGNISSKVLFIGDVKGTEKLYPVLDVKYDKWGIKYGWAGKQAMITVDNHFVNKKANYEAFLEEFNSESLPEKQTDSLLLAFVKYGGAEIALGPIGVRGMKLIDLHRDKKKVRQQLYLFGILEMYKNHLDEFMKS